MGRRIIMHRPKTKIEKITRVLLYAIMVPFTIYMLYLRYHYVELNKYEFIQKVWGDGNWKYHVILIVILLFLYIRSNLTAFKELKK